MRWPVASRALPTCWAVPIGSRTSTRTVGSGCWLDRSLTRRSTPLSPAATCSREGRPQRMEGDRPDHRIRLALDVHVPRPWRLRLGDAGGPDLRATWTHRERGG